MKIFSQKSSLGGECVLQCKSCGKKFPLAATIETIYTTTTDTSDPRFTTVPTPPYKVASKISKPCCPYCHSIELEEA